MEITKTSKDSIIIGLAGDVMIGRMVDEMLSYRDYSYLWGDTLPLLHATDLNLINLEAALTNSENAVLKVFNFKAKPERVDTLVLSHTDVVNLANNHCLDYSEEGLLETLQVLNRERIGYVGAGKNSIEAKRPLVIKVNGIKVGILGYTDNEPTWKAEKQSPGINFIEISSKDASAVEAEVKKLRTLVDLIILTIHWGPNMRERPPPHFKRFAHQLIDSGVDIIHGHSAHIFQGVELYKNKVIFYDTGDFVDDYCVDPLLRNDRSFFFLVEATSESIVSIRLVPTFISHCQVNLAKGIEKDEGMQRMMQLSKELNTHLNKEKDFLIANVMQI